MLENLVAVLEGMTDAFLALDVAWNITYVNQLAEKVLGRSRDDLVGKVIWDVFPQAWDSPFGREYRLAMEQQKRRDFESYSQVLDRWFLVHACPSPQGLAIYFHDLSDQRRAEAALRESEARYRSLFVHSMDAVLLTVADGRILMANSAASALFGYSESELIERGRAAVVDVSDPVVRAAIQTRSETGKFRGVVPMRKKGGDLFQAEISSSTFRDEQGVEWNSMFIRDVSDRERQAREREQLVTQLDSERAWLKTVLMTVPMGAIVFAPDGTLQFNEEAERLFGVRFSSDQGSAQYAHRLLYPNGKPVPREELVSTRVLRTGETVIGAEYLIERSDGTRFPILGSAAAIRGPDNEVIGGVGMFQDVSALIEAQQRIRQSELLLSGIFDVLPEGLSIADAQGDYVRHNAAIASMWATPPATVRDVCATSVRWAERDEALRTEEWPPFRALAYGESSYKRLLRLDLGERGVKVLSQSAIPLRDLQGKIDGVVVAYEDVTALKTSEDALRSAVRAREEMMRVVAHDLRSPLNGAVVTTQVLKRQVQRGQGAKLETTDNVLSALKRMNQLINDLLDASLLDAGALTINFERVAPGPLLAQLVESQRLALAEVGLELTLEQEESLPDLRAQPHRVLQVLENLVSNAAKFTPPGGQVSIRAEAREDVVIAVRDTGCGIAEAHLGQLFDRFWQVNRADKRGAGLGLAISKGIVEAHGGRMWVQSQEGRGTTFFFTIPAWK